ncbi:hypothetical protein [Escherichia coli]|uniref:hypothetical protein n=1 Tax=Escherichia coli TaxID=562 RepID=UPI00208DCF32|nr:hypothetical protein [Escherichia coli]
MLTLQVHWLAEKPDGKGSRSPFAIFPVRTVLPDTLIHEPDWHGGQCQSGVWRTIGAPDGSYSNLGSHREHLTGEITAEELCLCTLPVEMVPVAVIAPTHQIFRAM